MELRCIMCGEDFPNRIVINRHMRQRHRNGDGTYTCNICGTNWNILGTFNRHVRRQHVIQERGGEGPARFPLKIMSDEERNRLENMYIELAHRRFPEEGQALRKYKESAGN